MASNVTGAPENASPVAAGAPESQADRIQYLTPTPPGYTPEYDYLALLQSISETAIPMPGGPVTPLTRLLTGPPQTESCHHCRAQLIYDFGSAEWHWSMLSQSASEVEHVEHIYGQILKIRKELTSEPLTGTRVLLIDRIDHEVLQILGPAIDLDPIILWQHYNPGLGSEDYASGMAALRDKFFSLVAGERQRKAGANVDRNSCVFTTQRNRPIIIRGHLTPSTDESLPMHSPLGPNEAESHMLCYRVVANSCE